MKHFTMTAGLAVRSKIRRVLLNGGYDFREDKGFLDSAFIVSCTPAQYDVLDRWARDVVAEQRKLEIEEERRRKVWAVVGNVVNTFLAMVAGWLVFNMAFAVWAHFK